ncbi:hypothetical protein SFC43_07790 [Bacteroides sp. CR5/BHMF/2]|nr:hypothetical protein [Bacteroides sp. CR5/BHMF/2]
MVTTEQGELVQVKGKRETDEEGFAKLVKAATKKYGKPHFEEGTDFEGRPGKLYRWETKKEYIQLYAKSNSSKDTLVIAAAGNENGLVNMENDKPRLDVTLWRWKKNITIGSSSNWTIACLERKRQNYPACLIFKVQRCIHRNG